MMRDLASVWCSNRQMTRLPPLRLVADMPLPWFSRAHQQTWQSKFDECAKTKVGSARASETLSAIAKLHQSLLGEIERICYPDERPASNDSTNVSGAFQHNHCRVPHTPQTEPSFRGSRYRRRHHLLDHAGRQHHQRPARRLREEFLFTLWHLEWEGRPSWILWQIWYVHSSGMICENVG
jgi:hypothetical protein